MLGRLLCFLGFHRWSNERKLVIRCVRCRRIYLAKWAKWAGEE